MSEWISVEEELPPICKVVVVWADDDYEFGRLYGGDIHVWAGGSWLEDNSVDYWMPLPEPPKE